MTSPDQPSRADNVQAVNQERYVGEYLLESSPASIVVLGKLPIDLRWLLPDLKVMSFDSLKDLSSIAPVVSNQSQTDNEHVEKAVLVMNLDSLANHLPSVVGDNAACSGASPTNAENCSVLNTLFDQALGLAIRKFPWCVLAHCSLQGFADSRFFAFGFSALTIPIGMDSEDGHAVAAKDQESSGSSRWYEYRLSEYKRAPDWLNARFWANPERFSLLDVNGEYDGDPDESAIDDEFDDTSDEEFEACEYQKEHSASERKASDLEAAEHKADNSDGTAEKKRES